MEPFSGPFIRSCFCSGTWLQAANCGPRGLGTSELRSFGASELRSFGASGLRAAIPVAGGQPQNSTAATRLAPCLSHAQNPQAHCQQSPAAACALKPSPVFATALIATKPVKPCDGAVFGAFYLLLFLKRNLAADCGLQALSNPETSPLRQRGLRPAPPCTRQAPASHRRKPSPQASRRPHAANHRRFRYRFDSGKAPETVR